MKKIWILALSASTVWGCILQTDAVKRVKRTKWYKWCHEECSDTDDWKTLLCFFCNTEYMPCLFTLTAMFGETYLYQSFSKLFCLIESFIFFWLSRHFDAIISEPNVKIVDVDFALAYFG